MTGPVEPRLHAAGRRPAPAAPPGADAATGGHTELVAFLRARLTEELAALWERERTRPDSPDRPGLAAQVEVLDGLLSRLDTGRLPDRFELLLLLHCYGAHPGYDPGWATVR